MELSYISANGEFLPYVFLIFPSSKNEKNPLLKCFFYFEKLNFVAPYLENFLYFRKELVMPENEKFLILLFKYKRKRKKFLIKKQHFLN